MVFSSAIFLFAFLPAFLTVYLLTPARWRSAAIVVGSWIFYGWWRLDFLLLYALVTLWSYGIGALIAAAASERASRLVCVVGVTGSLSVLAFFKYWTFFSAQVIALFGIADPPDVMTMSILLPIGVSFFVFESVSYMVDVHRKDAPAARNFLDFAAFLALFPHLIAGPVMRYKDLSAQIVERTHTWSKFSEGCVLFLVGFSKKVLIADSVAPVADAMFALPTPTLQEAWLGAVAYSIQLYFDFSGYSEMAVGIGLMMGFRLIRNFDSPYVSASITEFWRRWHISLSAWLRDYLYVVLGGNRKGRVRTYVNLMITMVLGGLWHGANWTFVLWGAWHGVWLAIERALGAKGGASPYPRLVGLPLTLLRVMIGWVLFRSPDLATAGVMYAGMAGLNGAGFGALAAVEVRSVDLAVLLVGIAIVFLEPHLTPRLWASRLPLLGVRLVDFARPAMVATAAIAVLKLAADSFSPFLYFQF